MNAWKATPGVEEVATCKECGCKSTDDLRGLDAFVYVVKGYGCVRMCKTCADLHKYGQAGLMAVLLKETRDRAGAPGRPPTRFLPNGSGNLVVPCVPARAPTVLERLQHVAACSKWARENVR